MSAVHQVLSIPELLEHILLYLPERDLLLDQRVSTTWRNIITITPSLQRKLFFKADVVSFSRKVRWNPFLEYFTIPFPPVWKWHLYENIATFSVGAFERANSQNASWKRMHMTQPPLDYARLRRNRINEELPNMPHRMYGDVSGLGSGIQIDHLRSLQWEYPTFYDDDDKKGSDDFFVISCLIQIGVKVSQLPLQINYFLRIDQQDGDSISEAAIAIVDEDRHVVTLFPRSWKIS